MFKEAVMPSEPIPQLRNVDGIRERKREAAAQL